MISGAEEMVTVKWVLSDKWREADGDGEVGCICGEEGWRGWEE